MPRNRILKSNFWQDERFFNLSYECKLLALAILNFADDEGNFKTNLNLIKGFCFPFLKSDKLLISMFKSLYDIGYICFYENSESETFGNIKNFRINQSINKPKKSKFIMSKSVLISEVYKIDNDDLLNFVKKYDELPVSAELIRDLYHEILPELPKVKLITNKRISNIKIIFKSWPNSKNPEWWRRYFEVIREPENEWVLNGINSWKGDFDYLIRLDKLMKFVEQT